MQMSWTDKALLGVHVFILHVCLCQLSTEQQLSESRHQYEQLSREHDDVMQELGQVKDELTSEKQLRLDVSTVYFFVTADVITTVVMVGSGRSSSSSSRSSSSSSSNSSIIIIIIIITASI